MLTRHEHVLYVCLVPSAPTPYTITQYNVSVIVFMFTLNTGVTAKPVELHGQHEFNCTLLQNDTLFTLYLTAHSPFQYWWYSLWDMAVLHPSHETVPWDRSN